MSELLAKHLVLVRHGESEGDVRRSLKDQPLSKELLKHPRDEEETKIGSEQSAEAGKWITKYVLGSFNLDDFDCRLVSPLKRTQQSARSLGLDGYWHDDPRLAERDRGKIQGMTKSEHHTEFPKSYQQMIDMPFHWVPPGGESLLQVAHRFSSVVEDFMQGKESSAIMMTHRDVIWTSFSALGQVQLDDVLEIDTNKILNGHVIHYTNINPNTFKVESAELIWRRSCTPWADQSPDSFIWTRLEA